MRNRLLGVVSLSLIAFLSFYIVCYYKTRYNNHFFAFADSAAAELDKESSWKNLLRGFGLYLSMMVGIVFGRVHTQFKSLERMRKGQFASNIRRAIVSPAMVRSLVTSPLIFNGVLLVCREQPDDVIAVLSAFQNGFFCDVIFSRMQQAEISGTLIPPGDKDNKQPTQGEANTSRDHGDMA